MSCPRLIDRLLMRLTLAVPLLAVVVDANEAFDLGSSILGLHLC